MCGFVGAFDGAGASRPVDEELRNIVLDMSRKIRHRGPDWSGVYAGGNAVLSHERLAIVDPLSGRQPLLSADGKLVLAAAQELRQKDPAAYREKLRDLQQKLGN